MSVYCCKIHYNVFKDYIDSINTILKLKIVIYDDLIITPGENVMMFIFNLPSENKWNSLNKNAKIYYINTEQMTRNAAFSFSVSPFINFINYCNKTGFVNEPVLIDYSKENIDYISNYNFKKQYFPYLITDKEINNITKLKNENNIQYDFGIIFYVQDRRKRIIDELEKRGYSVLVCKGWETERDMQIVKCKVLLNIHAADDYNIFESIRCDRLIFSGIKVISEKSLGIRNYGNLLHEVDYHNFVDEAINFLNKNTEPDFEILNSEKIDRVKILNEFKESL